MISISLKVKLWMYDAGNDPNFEVYKESYHELQNDYPIYFCFISQGHTVSNLSLGYVSNLYIYSFSDSCSLIYATCVSRDHFEGVVYVYGFHPSVLILTCKFPSCGNSENTVPKVACHFVSNQPLLRVKVHGEQPLTSPSQADVCPNASAQLDVSTSLVADLLNVQIQKASPEVNSQLYRELICAFLSKTKIWSCPFLS